MWIFFFYLYNFSVFTFADFYIILQKYKKNLNDFSCTDHNIEAILYLAIDVVTRELSAKLHHANRIPMQLKKKKKIHQVAEVEHIEITGSCCCIIDTFCCLIVIVIIVIINCYTINNCSYSLKALHFADHICKMMQSPVQSARSLKTQLL